MRATFDAYPREMDDQGYDAISEHASTGYEGKEAVIPTVLLSPSIGEPRTGKHIIRRYLVGWGVVFFVTLYAKFHEDFRGLLDILVVVLVLAIRRTPSKMGRLQLSIAKKRST